MTRRAARMLAALESGPKTRSELYDHADRFYLTNNAAAELRAAGYDVSCSLVDGDYTYALALLNERDGGQAVPLVEETGGQLAWEAA